MKSYVFYSRVSTNRQGISGLGLEAQSAAMRSRVGENAKVLATYVEVESGRRDGRPELAKALDHCRRTESALVISRLDRLTRSSRFLHNLLDSGVDLIFCDLPELEGPQGRFMLSTLAGIAELEAGLISTRTKAALAAAKARGVKLGGAKGPENLDRHRPAAVAASTATRKAKADAKAESWRTIISPMVAAGLSLREIARRLDGQDSGNWNAKRVSRTLARLGIAVA